MMKAALVTNYIPISTNCDGIDWSTEIRNSDSRSKEWDKFKMLEETD